MAIEFVRRVKRSQVLEKVVRKGTFYPVGPGEVVELFPIRVLAEAVERTSETLYTWEKNGFPSPLFKVEGVHRRFYSKDQILLAHLLYRNKYGAERGGTFRRDEFIQDILKFFHKPRLQVDVATGVVSFDQGVP